MARNSAQGGNEVLRVGEREDYLERKKNDLSMALVGCARSMVETAAAQCSLACAQTAELDSVTGQITYQLRAQR